MSTQKKVLQTITERLAKEKPIILHDAHDSGDYILLLRGLSKATLDRDLSHPEAQDPIMQYLQSVDTMLPFLHNNGLLSSNWDMHSLRIGDREVTGFHMPGGKHSIAMLDKLYADNNVLNPFTVVTTGADKGMIEKIIELQDLESKKIGGRA